MKLLKLIAVACFCATVCSAQVIPINQANGGATAAIVGQIQTATGGTVNHGTLTFTLSQPAVAVGTATLVTQPTACYTSTLGNVVGLPDPLVPPVLSVNTASGTLPAATYYVVIYYLNTGGYVSAVSPEASIILGSAGTLNVNAPILQPSGAAGYGIAISTVSGAETIQNNIIGWTQFHQSIPLVTGSNPLAINDSICNLYFSDQLIPSGTYYTVNLVNRNGSQISGFPQTWCTYGGASGSINVSQGAPTGNCSTTGVYYPTPIFSNPPLGAPQSINGAFSVTGSFSLAGAFAWAGISGMTGPLVPVELYGAVGDWNGTTGTDNTAAINACLSSVTGYCVLSAKSYKVAGTLSITNSGVSLMGTAAGLPSPSLYPTPSASTIISTCASCDILDVAGTSNANTISFNVFKDFTLARSVAPSGTARGLSIVYADGTIVEGVTSEDSIQDFYLKGMASQGIGRIENSVAIWGYSGVTETSGNLDGFFVDSSGGVSSNSLRVRNIGIFSALSHSGSYTTYGVLLQGSGLHDFHSFHIETATTDYGVFINQTGGSGLFSSSDIFIDEPVLDGCNVSCLSINGVVGTVSVLGGWSASAQGNSAPLIDIESSNHVGIMGHQMYFCCSGFTAGILVNGGGSDRIVGNDFGTGSATAIQLTSTTGDTVAGNVINGDTATTIVGLTSATNIAVGENSLVGNTATNGILIDSASHGISGLETNTIGSGITNLVVDNGGNALQKNPVAFSTLPTCTSGGEGSLYPVKDSTTATFNATVTGSGSNHIIAYCNGTNWVAH